MATLYWGGGTGTWDGFTTGRWYTDFARTTLSSRAPSAVDDVIFDSISNATAYTVTISNNTTVCRSCTIVGPLSGNLTLAGSGQLHVYGDLTLPATGLTRTYTGQIYFWGASQKLTTNGATLASTLNIVGGLVTLQDALTTSAIAFGAGTLNTNGKTVTLSASITTLSPAAVGGTTSSGTLNFGASTVSATTITSNVASGPLIINGGTSNLTLTAASHSLGGTQFTGATFYNVTFSSVSLSSVILRGNNTFNNLTFPALSAAGVAVVSCTGNQTVNGTLTIAGQSSVNRYFVQSDIIGTARTLTVATVSALTDVDFQDITVAGTSSLWSGTRLGDCGGNTNITFPAAKTVYWNGTTGGAWSGNFWATSSGGTVSTANFPLAQDTAIINDTGLNTGSSITGFTGYNLKTFTSTKTNAWTLAGTDSKIYGDFTLTAGITTSSLTVVFAGRASQNFTSAGNTLSTASISGYGSSVVLTDNLTTNGLFLNSGGLNTNGKTVSTTISFGSAALPFSLTLGSSNLTVGSFGNSSVIGPVFSVNAGTSTITVTLSGGTASFGFSGQSATWNNVIFSSASPTANTLYGTNTFANLTFTSPTTTGVNTVTLSGNQTITGMLALAGGASVIQRLGFYSDILGTQRTLTAAVVSGLSDIDFKDIVAAGVSAPWSGTRLGNCQNNSGITFVAGANKYWNLTGTQNWSATAWATSSGGTPAANNFPLAQDTAVFDNTGAATTVTIDSQWNSGTIDMSGRTTAMTLAGSQILNIYGSVTYGSGITSSFTGTLQFQGATTQTLTTAGKSLACGIAVNNPTCVFRHGDACTTTSTIGVTSGSYSTQNYNITCGGFISNGTITRSITFGSSTVTSTGNGVLAFAFSSTGLTFSGASSVINLSSSGLKTFAGGNQTFGTVSSTGGTTNTWTIIGSNTFGTLTNSAFTYMIWTYGTTQTITNFTYSGAAGNLIRWYTSAPGQQATIKQVAATAVGTNSTDGGNNTGLVFTGTSPNYFYVKDILYTGFYNGASNFLVFF